MRISDWSSDVCSSESANPLVVHKPDAEAAGASFHADSPVVGLLVSRKGRVDGVVYRANGAARSNRADPVIMAASVVGHARSEVRRVGKEWVNTCRSRWSH